MTVPGSDEQVCPMCAEVVKAKAIKCRYCGYDFGAKGPIDGGMRVGLAIIAVLVILAVATCDGAGPSEIDSFTSPAVLSEVATDGVSAEALPAVDVSDAYFSRSTKARCSGQYPSDFSMRAACSRNDASGRGDFVRISKQYEADPTMRSALAECFGRYTQPEGTDFAMIGACARNQAEGYRETMDR